MKPSEFNLFMNDGNDFIVYNTFRGSITRVNEELRNLLNSREILKLQPSKFDGLNKKLKEVGIVVDDTFDERKEFGKIHEQWKTGRNAVEFNVTFTYDCNFECPYCYEGRGEKGAKLHGFKYMDEKTIDRTSKFIKKTTENKNAKRLELILYGGEPFLVPDQCKKLSDDIYDWSKERGINFNLSALSNGSLITEDIVDWLSDYKTRLQIPIDGNKELHDKSRFYKDTKRGSYEDIMKVLGMTKGKDIETHLRISLTKESYPKMEELLDDLKSRGLNHVYTDFCYITAFTEACANFEPHCLSDNVLFKVLPELWKKSSERGFSLDIRPRVQPLSCSSVSDGSFIIDPFSDVYKCWELVGLKEHSVGHLNDDGSLTKTPVYEKVLKRNPLNIEGCNTCNLVPACAGGCVCKSYSQNSTYDAKGCGSVRYLIRDQVKTYLGIRGKSEIDKIKVDNYSLGIIEDGSEPRMSHCYVLV